MSMRSDPLHVQLSTFHFQLSNPQYPIPGDDFPTIHHLTAFNDICKLVQGTSRADVRRHGECLIAGAEAFRHRGFHDEVFLVL